MSVSRHQDTTMTSSSVQPSVAGVQRAESALGNTLPK